MNWCPSCGGILGRECFNPDECAWITRSLQVYREQDLEHRVARLEAALAARLVVRDQEGEPGGS